MKNNKKMLYSVELLCSFQVPEDLAHILKDFEHTMCQSNVLLHQKGLVICRSFLKLKKQTFLPFFK